MSNQSRWLRIVPAGLLIAAAIGVGYYAATAGPDPENPPADAQPLPRPAALPRPGPGTGRPTRSPTS